MKNNKKGFTLVELLAVIVVLAIIMIIAVPSVLTAMDSARKNTFTIEARKIIEAGMAQRQADELAGNINKNVTTVTVGTGASAVTYSCYTFASIGIDNGGRYHGVLLYTPSTNTWQIKMSDGSNMTKGTTAASATKNANNGWVTLAQLNDSGNIVANTVSTTNLPGLDVCSW